MPLHLLTRGLLISGLSGPDQCSRPRGPTQLAAGPRQLAADPRLWSTHPVPPTAWRAPQPLADRRG